MSRKKHMLNVAASSGVSGGVRRVLTAPGVGTFAINASAQIGLIGDELDARSLFIQQERTVFTVIVETNAAFYLIRR
jgi:hypothetical protein